MEIKIGRKMISYLEGIIKEKSLDRVVLLTGGVGYELFISGATHGDLKDVGAQASLFVHLHIREDIMQLFGFSSRVEKEMFMKLISVSKVGPKLALSILSSLSLADLTGAIILGDIDLIVSIPGIGKKVAERLILEMKERVEVPASFIGESGIYEDSDYLKAKEALVNLGYSQTEASIALKNEVRKDASVEDMIKAALKRLAKS
ncbi:MAG: Holliday junction branch migration protein RuvA [Actinomycetota bacterium]|nr:Holliday junction branch migration protein RuvA [Actinomycetota bacterium]